VTYWLVKSEPDAWSWAQQLAKGVEPWTGVRNHQAAANLRAMKPGERAFFYHSNQGKEIVGIVSVLRPAYPDPTDTEGKWVAVDMKAERTLQVPVTLARIKAEPALADILLVRNSRLSVMPIPDAAWRKICVLGGIAP